PLEKHWIKYRLSLDEIHDRHHRSKDNVITMSPEHDVKTDRFTELAEYFYGFDKQEDALKYFTYLLKKDEALQAYYKENPDKQNPEYSLSDLIFTLRDNKPLVSLMTKYLKGKRLTLRENRRLYRLYIEYRAITSPIEINRERASNRKLLTLISSMRKNVRYAACDRCDLDKLERLCIKLLERPKEVTSSEYSEFASLRDSILELKHKKSNTNPK
ncbi:MAG: hypothetical protein H7843_08750, partial [Nitrospirota bacterium]